MAKIEHLSPEEYSEVAEMYARIWHRGQTYNNGDYTDLHIREVVGSLIQYGHGDNHELIAAGWLHDGPEDSPDNATMRARLRLIGREFSVRTENLVWAVTGVGKNRKERNASAYDKIQVFQFDGAATLKGHDRLINARTSRGTSLHAMYQKEYPGFREIVHTMISADLLTALDEAHS